MTVLSPPPEKPTTKPGPLARTSDYYIALCVGLSDILPQIFADPPEQDDLLLCLPSIDNQSTYGRTVNKKKAKPMQPYSTFHLSNLPHLTTGAAHRSTSMGASI